MPPSPEVQITVALVALLGSLIASYVALTNTRERARLQGELVELKAKLDALTAANLNEKEFAQKKELIAMEERMQKELTQERIREALNETNWQRVLDQVLIVKRIAADLLSMLTTVCTGAHQMSDDQILNETLAIFKLHRDFRDAMKPLFGEIRPKDYDRLEHFHKYQGKIILDIGRTVSDRAAKRLQMLQHADYLAKEKRHFEALAAHFLKPRFKAPSVRKLPGTTDTAS